MDLIKLAEKIRSGKTVYIYDDWYDIMEKLVYDKKSDNTSVYLKKRGKNEISSISSNELAFEIRVNGEEVSEEDYNKF